MLKYFILILCFMSFKTGLLYSNDIREFEVGTSIKSIPKERYTNIRCLDSEKSLKLWNDFNLCKKRNDDNFYLGFEYDDKYAFNENFEGTQIAGHPVTINIAINKKGIIEKITVNTDPNAPPYFKKQAHLFWMRVYSKYGSKDWECKDIEQKWSMIKDQVRSMTVETTCQCLRITTFHVEKVVEEQKLALFPADKTLVKWKMLNIYSRKYTAHSMFPSLE